MQYLTTINSICGTPIIIDEDKMELFKNESIFLGVNSKYAMLKIDGKLEYLHRLIIDAKKGDIVDHINLNKLDNRLNNLRLVTISENKANQNKSNIINPTSKYKGVFFDKTYNRWVCKVQKNNKVVFHGKFTEEFPAALAYNHHAKLVFGENARLNDLYNLDNLNWQDFQIKRNKLTNTDYKYISSKNNGNTWKANVQSTKYGNSKSKNFKFEYQAVLYCNQEIIDRNLHILESSKVMQPLKMEDISKLTVLESEIYNHQIKIMEEINE